MGIEKEKQNGKVLSIQAGIILLEKKSTNALWWLGLTWNHCVLLIMGLCLFKIFKNIDGGM